MSGARAQRFGGALNLNIHVHALVLDGVFARGGDGRLAFHPLRGLTTADVADVLAAIEPRVRRLLERRGTGEEGDGADPFVEAAPALAGLSAASIQGGTGLGRAPLAPCASASEAAATHPRRFGVPPEDVAEPTSGACHARWSGSTCTRACGCRRAIGIGSNRRRHSRRRPARSAGARRRIVSRGCASTGGFLPYGRRTSGVARDVAQLANTVRPRPSSGGPRLPVDRVFTMRGFGTVVTGTLVAGRMAVDDELVLLPSGRIDKAMLERVTGLLLRQEVVVRLGELLFHDSALHRLKEEVRAKTDKATDTLDVATFKERYQLTRKYAIPLL